MTHEEIMNEVYEVSAFLLKKVDLLKKQWFFDEKECKWKLHIENRDDRDLFNTLASFCENSIVHKLYDIESGYRSTANEFRYREGDGTRKRMREEEAE